MGEVAEGGRVNGMERILAGELGGWGSELMDSLKCCGWVDG